MEPTTLKMVRNSLGLSVRHMAGHLCTTAHVLQSMEDGKRLVDRFTADAALFIVLQNEEAFRATLRDILIDEISIKQHRNLIEYRYVIVERGAKVFKPIKRMNVVRGTTDREFDDISEARLSVADPKDRFELRMYTENKLRKDVL